MWRVWLMSYDGKYASAHCKPVLVSYDLCLPSLLPTRFCSIHHGRQIGDPDSLWTGFRVVIGINNFMEICERGINQQLLRKLPGQSQLTVNELDLGKYKNQHIEDTASLAIFVSNSVDKKTRMIFGPSRYFLVIRRICRKTKSNYEMSLGRIRALVTWQN